MPLVFNSLLNACTKAGSSKGYQFEGIGTSLMSVWDKTLVGWRPASFTLKFPTNHDLFNTAASHYSDQRWLHTNEKTVKDWLRVNAKITDDFRQPKYRTKEYGINEEASKGWWNKGKHTCRKPEKAIPKQPFSVSEFGVDTFQKRKSNRYARQVALMSRILKNNGKQV